MQITPQRFLEIAEKFDSEIAPSREQIMANWDENDRKRISAMWKFIVRSMDFLAEEQSFHTWTKEDWFRAWLGIRHLELLTWGVAKHVQRRALAALKEKLDAEHYRIVERILKSNDKELAAENDLLKGGLFASGLDTREKRKRALLGKIVEWMKENVLEINGNVNATAQIFTGDIGEVANDLRKEKMWKAHRSLPECIRNEVAELYAGAKDHQSLRKDLEKYLKNMARPINAL